MNDSVTSEIGRLKADLDAVIFAHNYQCREVQEVADFLGDSLELSRLAAKIPNRTIVFAGVKFMAETAKILAPEKLILLPRLDAGCPMADMITLADLRDLRRNHPEAMVVTYVNSSAEIKAESDLCCTSANAVQVVRNVPSRKVIFIPDKNLGAFVARHVPEKEIILFEGYCYVHNRIKAEEIDDMKGRYPTAPVLVHPEAPMSVLQKADVVLSTSGMLDYAQKSPAKEFIVATEQGLLERMAVENPAKVFYPAGRPKICSNMKRTSREDLIAAMKNRQYRIDVDERIAVLARKSLAEMLRYV